MKKLEEMTTEELLALRGQVEALCLKRQLQNKQRKDREVGETRRVSGGTLRQEYVKCGKQRCKKCPGGAAHGPYWYLYRRRGRKVVSKYLGKGLPEELQQRAREAPGREASTGPCSFEYRYPESGTK